MMNDNEADWQALVERRDKLKGIRGKPIGAEPADEAEHFYACPVCGQSVDKRDIFAVLHQEEHERLPAN